MWVACVLAHGEDGAQCLFELGALTVRSTRLGFA